MKRAKITKAEWLRIHPDYKQIRGRRRYVLYRSRQTGATELVEVKVFPDPGRQRDRIGDFCGLVTSLLVVVFVLWGCIALVNYLIPIGVEPGDVWNGTIRKPVTETLRGAKAGLERRLRETRAWEAREKERTLLMPLRADG